MNIDPAESIVPAVAIDPAEPIDRAARISGSWTLPALGIAAFISTLPTVAPAPFFPVIARDLGVGVPLVGQVATAMLLLSAMLGFFVGPLADRYGHRRVIVIGLVASAACLITFGLAPVFLVLLVASLFGGLAAAAGPGQAIALASTHFAGSGARRAIGWVIAAQAGTAIVGAPLLAAIGDWSSWRVAFVGSGLAAAAMIWFVANALPRDTRRPETPFHLRRLFDAYPPLLRHPGMRRLYISLVLRVICWLGMLTYFGAFLDEELGMSTRTVGLMYMLGGSGFFLGSLAAGGPLAGIPPRRLVAGANVALAITWAVMFSGVAGIAGTSILAAIIGVTGALGWAGMAALLTAETPVGVGTTMALGMSLNNLGAVAGYGAMALILPLFGLASVPFVLRPGTTHRESAGQPT
jgi:MFS transporter, DHA1 family, inner membrane transport protein